MSELRKLIQDAADAGELTLEQLVGKDESEEWDSVAELLKYSGDHGLKRMALKCGLIEPEAPSLPDIYATLEAAANRAFQVNAALATAYQMGLLAGLIHDSGDRVQDICHSNYVLTEASAKRLIDAYNRRGGALS